MQIITTVCAKLSKLTILGLEVLNVSIHRYTAGVRIKRQLNFVPVPWEFCHHEVKTPVRVLSSWNKKRKNFIIVNKIFYSIRIIHTIWQGAPRTTCTELNLNYIFHVMPWYVMICHVMSWVVAKWWPSGQHLATRCVEWLNLISAVSWIDWAQCC